MLTLCSSFYIQDLQAFPKDLEECRIKATIAQDTNVIYDVDLTPQHESLIVGPEYYKLTAEEKNEVVEAYNCMMRAGSRNATQENRSKDCFNFSLKDYQSGQIIAEFVDCKLRSRVR